jgi:hypothetical protein
MAMDSLYQLEYQLLVFRISSIAFSRAIEPRSRAAMMAERSGASWFSAAVHGYAVVRLQSGCQGHDSEAVPGVTDIHQRKLASGTTR